MINMKKALILLALLCFSFSLFAIDTGTRFEEEHQIKDKARYSIKFGSADLKHAIRFLAKAANLNVIIPEDIEGSVNVSFDDIQIEEAMHSIIKANGLDYAHEMGIVRVGSGDKFLGTGEDLKTETFKLKYASAKELKEEISPLLSNRGSVLADERTNSLIIRDMKSNIENVKELVGNVDIRDAQILIEAKIVEATRDFTRNLGVEWFGAKTGGKWQTGGYDKVGSIVGFDGTEYGKIADFPATGPTSALGIQVGTFKGVDIGLAITAAEQRGDLDIISEPSIVTSNGKEANIRSGETLLVATSGDVNIGNSGGAGSSGGGDNVQEIETGVELTVTPQIAANRFIRMDIDVETSQADFSRSVGGLPVIVDNTASTSVMIRDGETTIIGGLFKYQNQERKNAVPGLSRIPLLGNLFKSKDKSKSNKELMIFIKPTIVRDISQIPVQARVREIEAFKKRMTMPRLFQEEMEKEEEKRHRKSELKRERASKPGNKYIRYRDERGL